MKKVTELHHTQLKNGCAPEELAFRTTAELEPLEGIIGQERAVKAFDFGLAVKMKGYNIYMSGPSGTGKTTYARRSTEALAATEPVPMDWCYVYNFQKPKEPAALSFQAGVGKAFRDDMAKLVTVFQKELTRAFRSEDFEKQKLALIHSSEQQQNELLDQMEDAAAGYGFHVERTEAGVYFVPLVNYRTNCVIQ